MRKDVVIAAVTTAATVLVVATLLRKWKKRSERQWRKTQRILKKFARECATPVSKLWQIADDLVEDMQTSLASDGRSSLNMLISYVNSLPTGEEKGLYYGVNMRGTNFLILCARIGGKNEPISDLHREEIAFPSHIMAGTSQEVFDYIAQEVAKFVASYPGGSDDISKKERKLGFTVSYPVDQATALSGSAIKWKNFSADDPEEKEMVNDINRALEKHGVHMRVFALVTDTIGDLAGGRYYNRDSVAAVTLAMGTNAAYLDRAQAASKRQGLAPDSEELVVSIEWGDFKSHHLPLTEFDASLDVDSSNPCTRMFEKLISGMYLGEIVRRVLLKMAQDAALFGDTVPPKLTVPYSLSSPDMAAMHQDSSEDHDVVSEKLREIFEITNSTPLAREVVAEVCDIVAERASRLAGAGMVGIVKKLGRIESKLSVVTVEGGLYEHYRVFRNYLNSSVWEMLGNDLSDNVIVEHSHGGSGTGALFLAACQTQNLDS